MLELKDKGFARIRTCVNSCVAERSATVPKIKCVQLTFPNVRCVIDTSSSLMLNSPARCNKSARILEDTWNCFPQHTLKTRIEASPLTTSR